MQETARIALRVLRACACTAAALFSFVLPAGAETSPHVITTPPLKLFGDGAAPSAPPRQDALTIATPPLRLVGDGATPPMRDAPVAPVTIETRPLKLLGAKP